MTAPSNTCPWPTLIHVTHGKSGSQWIHRILNAVAPDRVVPPAIGNEQFLKAPIQPSMVYPTVYVTREEFDGVVLPPGSRYFIVIRDLRDTLVSLYFSLRFSHVEDDPVVTLARSELTGRGIQDGLAWLMDHADFHRAAAIQLSWLQCTEPIIRYEDLLQRDEAVLEDLFLHRLRLPVEADRLRSVVRACRFETLTGRYQGEENVHSHNRKGISGDWQNYFGERITTVFKQRYGEHLLATGYEQDLDWQPRHQLSERTDLRAGVVAERGVDPDLQAELDRRLALIQSLHRDLEERLALINRLDGECSERDRRIESLSARVRELEKACSELAQVRETLRSRVDELEAASWRRRWRRLTARALSGIRRRAHVVHPRLPSRNHRAD